MHSILYIEMNAFALTVLLAVYLNIRRGNKDVFLFEQKLFLLLVLSDALILVFDSLMWILDGTGGIYMREINQFVTVMYYALNPIICLIWSLYADYLIFRSERRLTKIAIPLVIPTGIVVILSLMSVFNGALFYIDANNVYHRGALFLVMTAVCYFYLLYTLIKVIRMKKRIEKNDYAPILFFAFPPFLGGIVQILFFGVSLIWICTTMSILIVFLNIQNHRLYTDYMTGLFNRRQLDNHLLEFVQRNGRKGLRGGIMIDLNDFKMINDVYGHETGDQALKDTAQILRNTFRTSDFIARYGGDEFMVIMDLENDRGLQKAVDRLRTNVAAFNAAGTTPYSISLSIGYDIYDFDSGMTIEEFIKHIDILMYEDKQRYDKKFLIKQTS